MVILQKVICRVEVREVVGKLAKVSRYKASHHACLSGGDNLMQLKSDERMKDEGMIR
jgi:hypothetical protein